ncbi:MAG: hypothetical protein QM731_11385 [Chitinophagaceae bacterium]
MDLSSLLSRITFSLVLGCMLLTGCKKDTGSPPDEDNGDYYMKFTVGGVKKEYRKGQLFLIAYGSEDKLYTALISAKKSDNSNGDLVAITIQDPKPFSAKTYYDKNKLTDAQGQSASEMIFVYDNDKALGYASLGFVAGLPPYTNVTVDTRLTITQITSKYARGTFSGTIYTADLTDKLFVSDGEFYLPVLP